MEQSENYVELWLYVSIQASKSKIGFLFLSYFSSWKDIYYRR